MADNVIKETLNKQLHCSSTQVAITFGLRRVAIFTHAREKYSRLPTEEERAEKKG